MSEPSFPMRQRLVAAAGALVAVLAGWSMLRAGRDDGGPPMAADGRAEVPSATVAQAPPEAAPAGQAPLQVTATELFRQYQASQGRAGGQYLHQRFGLSGVLNEVEQGAGGAAVLSLVAGPDLERIRAVMKPAEQAKAAGLAPGTRVSLNCLHQGAVMGEPVLGDCVLQPP